MTIEVFFAKYYLTHTIMIKGIFKQSGFGSKLLLLLLVFIFSMLISILLTSILVDNDMNNIRNVKIMQLIQSVGMFIVPPFVLAFLWSENVKGYLNLKSEIILPNAALVINFMIVVIPFINLLSLLNQQIVLPDFLKSIEEQMKMYEQQVAEITEKMLNVHSFKAFSFNIILIAALPALGEELFFRGTLQKIISEKRNFIYAIWVTAIVFSVIHLQFYGFFPRMLLGAFFGYLLFWSGNLWYPILAHFINNAIAVIFYYLKFNGYRMIDIDTIGTGNTLWLGIASGLMSLIILRQIRIHLKRERGK